MNNTSLEDALILIKDEASPLQDLAIDFAMIFFVRENSDLGFFVGFVVILMGAYFWVTFKSFLTNKFGYGNETEEVNTKGRKMYLYFALGITVFMAMILVSRM